MAQGMNVRGTQKLLDVLEMFGILIVVIVLGVSIYQNSLKCTLYICTVLLYIKF